MHHGLSGASVRIRPLQQLFGNGRNVGTFSWTVPQALAPKVSMLINRTGKPSVTSLTSDMDHLGQLRHFCHAAW